MMSLDAKKPKAASDLRSGNFALGFINFKS
jgi:hypothetical protein